MYTTLYTMYREFISHFVFIAMEQRNFVELRELGDEEFC